jgi:transcriptional regulator of acetoin/glycerol metabolism
MADRALDLAWTHSQVILRQLNASEAEAQLYTRLAGAIIFADPARRANPGVLLDNRRGQSGLWTYGISGDTPLDCRIARVAVPVLSAMAEVMIGANTSLLLSAPDGTMLWRWTENSRLTALLDRSSAVVGTRWSEDVVGTNGIGTSLETIRPIVVSGAEHFSEALHPFTCAGAPIRHPITRRVAGTLSVTSLVEDASPLMGATLKKLTREIAEQLYGDSTLRERELLHHFLSERRRGRNAVVAVNHDTVIANTAEAQLRTTTAPCGTRSRPAAGYRAPRRGLGRVRRRRELADDRACRLGRRSGDRRRPSRSSTDRRSARPPAPLRARPDPAVDRAPGPTSRGDEGV